jgi:dTDP-4-dehydrorhamnose reductase
MYKTTDFPTETNLYGKTKALGELKNGKDITLRVSIIGPEIKQNNKSGLFNWVLNESPNIMEGWTNAFWNGITTLQLAKTIEKCIEESVFCSGIIQPSGLSISKAELLQLIVNVYNLDKKVKFVEGPKSINKCLIPTRDYEAPSHLKQLMELREFYGTERAK